MLQNEEILLKEKHSLISHMKNKNYTYKKKANHLGKKNLEMSITFRKEGNVLYKKKPPYSDDNKHFNEYYEILNMYTQSIIYAPSNSEQLALAHGNRSALLRCLEIYEECILDCDKAISITTSNYLKVKLLCRKAESLHKLNRPTQEICEEALLLLDNLKLEMAKKTDYVTQLSKLLESSNPVESEQQCKNHNYADVLSNFKRSEEVPCASKSVAVRYNEKWRRHIVATEDIPAGKIIAIEKQCLTYHPMVSHSFMHCSNCMEYIITYAIPCEHCTFNVYCSELCLKEAWSKYHQFECCVRLFLSYDEPAISISNYVLRFILLAIYEAGGIEQMKQQLLEIEHTKDPRIKGFSDGIFQDDKLKSIFSFQCIEETKLTNDIRQAYIEYSCLWTYLLAEETNFFGKKMNLSMAEILFNENLLFTAALFLRLLYISSINRKMIISKNNGFKSETIGFYIPSFGNLINHSCVPNVEALTVGDGKIIYFTRYPIEKGSQIFIAYNNNIFTSKNKEKRQKFLQDKYDIICDCIACTENWSSLCLPSMEEFVKNSPLKTTIFRDIPKIMSKTYSLYLTCLNELGESKAKFKPKLAKKNLYNLKLLSENFTVHCHEYRLLLESLDMLYTIAFVKTSKTSYSKFSFLKSAIQIRVIYNYPHSNHFSIFRNNI